MALDKITTAIIADDAVTAAKIVAGAVVADIANDSIDSQHYVAGSIDNEHLADNAVGTDELADNAVTLAKMAGGTDGNLITYDTSGNPAYVATGTSGHVLTSAGADAVPTFQAAAKVLQVVQDVKTDTASTSSTGWVDTIDIAQAITPAATSKVLVICDINLGAENDTAVNYRIVRDSTAIYVGDTAGSRHRVSSYFRGKGNALGNFGSTYLDTHGADGSTEVTYKLQWKMQPSYTGWLNRDNSYTDNTSYATAASSLTLMEIGA